ncbi:MAG: hypothetical protein KDA46_07205 [Parvularculaceae bacterium]|nr:hypothetical protein [Parvularculaceae bacterium]
MHRALSSAITLVIAMTAAPPAFAADAAGQVSLCAAALDAEGLAPQADYRAKFVKSKGASTQRVVLRLIPVADGAALDAECTIKRGEVLTATIKS